MGGAQLKRQSAGNDLTTPDSHPLASDVPTSSAPATALEVLSLRQAEPWRWLVLIPLFLGELILFGRLALTLGPLGPLQWALIGVLAVATNALFLVRGSWRSRDDVRRLDLDSHGFTTITKGGETSRTNWSDQDLDVKVRSPVDPGSSKGATVRGDSLDVEVIFVSLRSADLLVESATKAGVPCREKEADVGSVRYRYRTLRNPRPQ